MLFPLFLDDPSIRTLYCTRAEYDRRWGGLLEKLWSYWRMSDVEDDEVDPNVSDVWCLP